MSRPITFQIFFIRGQRLGFYTGWVGFEPLARGRERWMISTPREWLHRGEADIRTGRTSAPHVASQYWALLRACDEYCFPAREGYEVGRVGNVRGEPPGDNAYTLIQSSAISWSNGLFSSGLSGSMSSKLTSNLFSPNTRLTSSFNVYGIE